MSSPASTETRIQSERGGEARFSRKRKFLPIAVAIGVLVVCLAVVLFSRFWPFERGAVLQDLAEASGSTVEARSFHKTYFPFPGCILDGVIFHHGEKSARPLITIERLTVRGSYIGIFTHHVDHIIADGARVYIPAFGSGAHFQTQHSSIIVDEVV